MNYLRALLFAGLWISAPLSAQSNVEIFPRVCSPGMHVQPKGPFALYVFCDDALGTNVAVVLNKLHNPLSGKYSRETRFWQGEPWAKDVTSYVWLKDGKHLLLATSYIYGTGSVYLLNLETQQFQVMNPIQYGACLARFRQVDDKKLDVSITDCEDEAEYRFEIAM